MNIILAEEFYIIGIAVRTTNENGQSATDIPKLWDEFFSNDIVDSIPNKAEQAVYCVYTEYEGDYTKPYTTVLGCRVNNLSVVPEGFKGITVAHGGYAKFTAKGKLADQIVFQEWTKI